MAKLRRKTKKRKQPDLTYDIVSDLFFSSMEAISDFLKEPHNIKLIPKVPKEDIKAMAKSLQTMQGRLEITLRSVREFLDRLHAEQNRRNSGGTDPSNPRGRKTRNTSLGMHGR